MATISNNHKESVTFWQEWIKDNAPEPAILIEKYTDSFVLTQGSNGSINISKHEIRAFIKTLQKLL